MRKTTGLQRRVLIAFLLSGAVLGLASAAAGIELTRRVLTGRRLESTINRLGWASRTLERAYLAGGVEAIEERLAEVRRSLGAEFCVVRGTAGEWEATAGDLPAGWQGTPVGDSLPAEQGDYTHVRIRGALAEFVVPIRSKGEVVGLLTVGLRLPGLMAVAREVLAEPPLLLTIPVLLCLGSGLWLTRSLSGAASVGRQLSSLCDEEHLDTDRLSTVPATDPVAIGWNRLVAAIHRLQPGSTQARVEEAIKAYQAGRSTDVLDSLPDAIAVTDSAGQIRYANPAFRHLCALDSCEIEGKQVTEVMGLTEEQMRNIDQGGQRTAGGATIEVVRTKAGMEQILRIRRLPLRSPADGASTGRVWIVRDVTQQRIAERMKMQFMMSAIHELRTPLSNIRAYAETLASLEEINIERQKEFCNIITTEAIRLGRLIDDLLNLSQLDAGGMYIERKPTDLRRLVEDVVTKMQPGAEEKQLKFTVELPEKYFPIRVDKQKLSVALVNLIGNAIKYTPPGGEVSFRVSQTEQEVTFIVADTGIGISEEDLPKIFDRFYRARDARVSEITGSGIGLALAKEIVDLHGGTISVQSKLNEGSTFVVTIPCDG